MATAPKTPNNETTPEQRSEQLRAALARRDAVQTLRPVPPEEESSSSGAARALDTFETSIIPAAAVSLVDRERDEGELGENFTGEKELGQDDQNLADEVGNPFDEDDEPDKQSQLTGEEEEEDDDSPFNFTNPGRERVAELAAGLFGDAEQTGQDGGAAPGDGGMRDRIGAGKDSAADLVNPGGYNEEQSSLDSSEVAALLGGDVTSLLGARNAALNAELDVMTGLLGDIANTTTSKTSVAQAGGSSNPLSDAINSANSPEAQKEAADKYGVTPPSGSGPGAGTDGGAGPAAPPAEEKPWYERAANAVSRAIYGRDFMGDAGSGTGIANRAEMGELKGVDSGLGTIASGDKATVIEQSKQVDGAPAEAPATLGSVFSGFANQVKEADAARKAKEADEAKKKEEEAAKKKEEEAAKKKEEEEAQKKKEEEEAAKKDGGGPKQSGDPDDPDGDLGGPPTEAELAFRRHLYNATGYKGAGAGQRGGEVDPADDSTASNVSVVPTGVIAQGKESLIGQPVEPELASGGGGTFSGGNLPGDQGNVDFGEANDTGPFTSKPRGGDPGDVDTSPGGAPLERRQSDSDEDDSGESKSVVKSPFRFERTKDIGADAKSALADDDEDD